MSEPLERPFGAVKSLKRRKRPVRAMIVDDSLTVRTAFSRMIAGADDIEVAATASSAERAIAELGRHDVDVILLDLEMPGMGGLEALPKILEVGASAQVLVVSSLTEDGAEHTLAALSMGAADTMLKPQPGGFNDSYRESLLGKIRALAVSEADAATISRGSEGLAGARDLTRKRPEIVAIGASTGGIHALNIFLRALPREFRLPILVTQHLPASFMPVFARQIEVASARRTLLAEAGTEIRRGEILIATGEGHMTVQRRGERFVTQVDTSRSQSGCLPSVDPMFASLAEATGGRVLGILLSGMGRDGVEGAAQLVEAGGTVLAQNAETSAVWGMPGAVAKAGLASAVLPPEKLVERVLSAAGAGAWK